MIYTGIGLTQEQQSEVDEKVWWCKIGSSNLKRAGHGNGWNNFGGE